MTTSAPPFIQCLQQQPQSLALQDDQRTRSWAQLVGAALGWRATFLANGLEAGGHAAVLLNNRVEYFELLLAAAISGVWLTPLNRHLTVSELEYILVDSGARLLITEAKWIDTDASPAATCPVVDVELHALPPETGQPLEQLMALWEQPAGGFLMYTSGTTGRPKGVRRASPGSVGQALTGWASMGASLGLGGEGCHLVCGPAYHAAPGLLAFYDLMGGGTLIVQAGFEAESFCRAVEEYGIRRTHLVPTMFVRLLRQRPDFERDYAMDSLSMVLHGAAPVAPVVKQDMIRWWGEVLVEYWGASESGVITLIGAADWLAHEGSVGAPLPQYELSVRDESFKALATGEIGTLWARHRHLPQPFSYYLDDAKTASVYHGEWFTLGDLGYLDEAGYAYLADRRSNLIISGGVNIYPAEVESELLAHPDVMDVVVVGLDDEEWGKRVHALVQLRPGAAGSDALRDAILQQAARKLARFKLPRSLEFVDALPRVDSGKLYKGRLEHGSAQQEKPA